jgi:hypothetical protein
MFNECVLYEWYCYSGACQIYLLFKEKWINTKL